MYLFNLTRIASNLLTKNDDEYTQVQMLIKDSSGVKRTSLKKFRHRDPDRGNFAVFNRTLLINVNRGNYIHLTIGVITTFDWAPTTCIGDIQALAIEDICGYICGATCNANITVFYIGLIIGFCCLQWDRCRWQAVE